MLLPAMADLYIIGLQNTYSDIKRFVAAVLNVINMLFHFLTKSFQITGDENLVVFETNPIFPFSRPNFI